jgi:hypothetical protein
MAARRARGTAAAIGAALLLTALGLGAPPAWAQEHGGGSPPMPTADPGPMSGPTMPVTAPAGDQQVSPADHVAGSLVRLQTWAKVSVVVHHVKLYKVELEPHADPTLAGSGFFVNPSGVIATAAEVPKVDRGRLETWGINEAFVRTFGMPAPSDPYARVHAPDAEIDEHLQGCYEHERGGSECAVFVSTEIRAYPDVTPPVADGLLVTPIAQAGPIAVLSSTASGDVTTAALATAPSNHWTSVGWSEPPHGQPPATANGDFTGGDLALAPEAAAGLVGTSGADGSVLVDDRGSVVAMLRTADGKATPVGATEIAETLHKAGIEVRSGPLDTQLSTGLDYIGAQEYANAEPYLDQVAKTTGGQNVALKYLDVARQKKNTADDRTSMTGSHTGEPASGGTSWLPLWLTLAGIVVVAAAVAGFLWWRRRSSASATPPAPPRDHLTAVMGPGGRFTTPGSPAPETAGTQRATSPPAPAAQPAPVPTFALSDPGRPSSPPVPSSPEPPDPANGRVHPDAGNGDRTVVAQQPRPGGQSEFCSSCGTHLAPGDRFCYACGTPNRHRARR